MFSAPDEAFLVPNVLEHLQVFVENRKVKSSTLSFFVHLLHKVLFFAKEGTGI